MKKTLLAIAALACAGIAHADDADGPAVVPYRPSVSTPAQLSAPGWLELEAGGLRATGPDGSGASRTTLPYTLKLAFTPDWGIRVGGDAVVHQVEPGTTQNSFGDTAVVLKRRFAVSDATAWGLELGETFATAKDSVGIGHAQTTVNGIFSSDFMPGWHTDINVNETHLGGSGQPSAWQAGWAAAVSRNLSDAWGAVGEFSGTHQSGTPNQAQFLAAASWNESSGAVFDVGLARGLNDVSPRWQVFAGVTVRLAKLF
jgi:hypothetical protein